MSPPGERAFRHVFEILNKYPHPAKSPFMCGVCRTGKKMFYMDHAPRNKAPACPAIIVTPWIMIFPYIVKRCAAYSMESIVYRNGLNGRYRTQYLLFWQYNF